MESVRRAFTRVSANLRETSDMIAFKHTLFALPFAVISLITAATPHWPQARVWLWVGVAMVSARTAAMAFNRLVDHAIDAKNPRTASRSLPAARLSRRFVWTITGLSVVAFLFAAAQLNLLCLALAPATLAVLLGYSYAKRFTAASHLWLGLALGIAPVGAWIAVTGSLAWPPAVLAAGVCFWVAGFDVIYSLQDDVFDRENGLHSLPARLGRKRALAVARLFHLAAFAAFVAFALAAGGGTLRLVGVAAAGALLAIQHRMIAADDLGSVNAAFFTANGTLSVLMCALFCFAKITG
jgi:4-hydroxybenzoate polyprenyltransferase